MCIARYTHRVVAMGEVTTKYSYTDNDMQHYISIITLVNFNFYLP